MSKNNKITSFEIKYGDSLLRIEKGRVASLADSSVLVSLGDTVVLATAVVEEEEREGIDFFPLLVEYEERLYAAGKISGSRFVKREGRPSEEAVLAARLIDRPLRPLFPKDFRRDIQIIVTVLSYDERFDPDVTSIIAASACLLGTDAPFKGPIGAIRVGLKNGQFILNPPAPERVNLDLDLVVAGTRDRVMMLEGLGRFVPEKKLLEAIEFGLKELQPAIKLQEKLLPPDKNQEESEKSQKSELQKKVEKFLGKKLAPVMKEIDHTKREENLKAFEKEVLENFEGNFKQIDIRGAFNQIVEEEVRKAILKDKIRPDGRGPKDLRPLEAEVGLLPRTHGSSLFARGQTQVLSIATLGAPGEEQLIETMEEESKKRFMHHYNFPPFSTGEVRPIRSTSRREIGHGALVEKALQAVIPAKEIFPYTIRVVSEVLSSNGSTSMASVCASSLALMDAGVPIKEPVAGISIGLVKEAKDYVLLTDIQGIEDFAGDMDFKVAGNHEGVSAVQLDIKIDGLDLEILEKALSQSREVRLTILKKMKQTLDSPRKEVSPYAPSILVLKIPPDKIREVIGPGGKVINKIIEEAGGHATTSIDIEDDGVVSVASSSPDLAQKALKAIEAITKEAKVGDIFNGKVTRLTNFGAFVEMWPGQEGLVHISQIASHRIEHPADVVKIGDEVLVKVVEIDEQGRYNLSMKQT